MGAETQEKSSKDTSAESFKDYVFGEHEHTEQHHEPDALHREVQTTSDRSTASRVGDKNESPLETFAKGYEQLKELRHQGVTDANDPRVRELVAQTDAAFQKAWPHIQEAGSKAAVDLIGKPTAMADIQQERQKLDAELKAAGVPQGASLSGDALSNAVLNAPNDALRLKLGRIETLNELEQLTVNGAAQNMADKATPILASLKYANFLDTWKGGVSRPLEGSADNTPRNSLDVLMRVNSPEMQGMGGRDAITRAGDTQAKSASQVIPPEQNPYTFMQAALTAQTPQDALANAQKAADLAKNIKPEDCQAKQRDLTAQMNAATDAATKDNLAQQVRAWQALEHSSGLSNTILASAMLRQPTPDTDGARKALLTAASDPVGANQMLGQDGQPVYNAMLMASLTKGNGDIVNQIQQAGQTFQKAQEAAQKAEKETDDGKKKALLDEATTLGQQAIQQSKILKDSFAGKTGEDLQKEIDELTAKGKKNPDGKPTKEEQEKLEFLKQIQGLGQMQAQALAATASWDLAKGDGHAAQDLLNQLNEKDHPEFFAGKDDAFKNQLKEMKDGANSMAEDQDIDNKAWYNPMKYVDKAWKFCKDNAKWIAVGVAAVGALAITIGTAGAGAPVGAAILAGAVGGFIGGTAVGGGLEWASGRAKNWGEGMVNVAPYAAAGGVGGALGGYFFAPAALTAMGGAAATESLGVAVGSGWMANMGAGFATGAASGAFYNAGVVRDGYRIGKYDSAGEAFKDWGTGTLAWGATGAIMAPAAFSGAGSAAEMFAARQVAMKPALNAVVGIGTGYIFPRAAEGMHSVANGTLASVTGDVPRWMAQAQGYSRDQFEAWKAQQEAQSRGEAPKGSDTQTQTQPAPVDNTAPVNAEQPQPVQEQPLPPSTYDPNKGANLDDYLK